MDPLLATGVALLLAIAGYAHYRIPFHTAGKSRGRLTRGGLLLAGLALGYVLAATATDRASALLAFVGGFSAVHVPAAAILFVKNACGSGKS